MFAYLERFRKTDFGLSTIQEYTNNWNCFGDVFVSYPHVKLMTLPFVEHVAQWKNDTDGNETLFSRLDDEWGLNNTSPLKLSLEAQIEFHINHWFKDLMEAEIQIQQSYVED